MKFKNIEGTNLNRKKLKIISQSPTEMHVLVENDGNITQEGTPLNAEVFNEFQQTIDNAKNQSTTAVSIANNAISIANDTKTKSDIAYQKSEEAINTANLVRNDFNSLNNISLSISPSNASWACEEVNNLPTSFGINYFEDSNIKFSSNDGYKTNVVIDGDYYGNDGQKKLAYNSDIPTKTSDLINDSNFITSSSNITGNASTSTRSSIFSGSDTRYTNSNPEYYFDKAIGSVSELKNGSSIGLNSYSQILLITHIPCSESSNGLPIQIAYAQNGKIYSRSSINATSWDSWKQIVLNPSNDAIIVNSVSQNFTGGLPQIGKAAGQSVLTKDCLAIFNPGTADDAGWIRLTGSDESDTTLEIATGDDGGYGEAIVVRQYDVSNSSARQATLLGNDGNTSFPGNITAGGYINTNSDIRLKKDITNIDEESVKDFVENTQIKAFTYISNGDKTIGVIAQDIESKKINNASFIELDKDGYLKVHETKFVYLLWNYCQQLNMRLQKIEKTFKEK